MQNLANKPVEETSNLEFTAVLMKTEDGGYVSYILETGTSAQGETEEEAFANLREEIKSHLEEWPFPKGFQPRATLKWMKVSVNAE